MSAFAERPTVHIVGGGMLGDRYVWCVTIGRMPNRRAIASGEAPSMTEAERQAGAAREAWEAKRS